MSKVVKGVGRAVKRVVSGIAKVAKKILKSPVGKMLAVAVGAFFIGPMVSAFSSGFAGASGGFMSQLGAGLSSAGQAFTSTVSGIGNSIASTFGGAAPVGETAVLGGAGELAGGQAMTGLASGTAPTVAAAGETLGTGLANAPGLISGSSGMTGGMITEGLGATAMPALSAAPSAAGTGLITRALGDVGSFMSQNKLWPEAVKLGGGMMQGFGQAKMLEDQRQYETQTREKDLQRMYDNWRLNGGWSMNPNGRFA